MIVQEEGLLCTQFVPKGMKLMQQASHYKKGTTDNSLKVMWLKEGVRMEADQVLTRDLRSCALQCFSTVERLSSPLKSCIHSSSLVIKKALWSSHPDVCCVGNQEINKSYFLPSRTAV